MQREPREADPQDYAAGFRLTEDERLADVLDDYAAAAAETDAEIRRHALADAVPVPGDPWMPKDVDAWSVRWVVLHLIE